MSLLPNRIPPPTEPLGTIGAGGQVTISKNWWLLLYNIAANSIGTGGAAPDDTLEIVDGANTDGAYAEALQALRELPNVRILDDPPVDVLPAQDLANILTLVSDLLLQDAQRQAQPSQSITPTGSPFTYTAPFDGTVVVAGGTVSAVAIVRQGTSVATGIIAGLFPLSRSDQLTVTYSGVPTMTFLPR